MLRIALWLALAANLHAAAVLRGVVLAAEIGGAPMEAVAVAAPGANRVTTPANGEFLLEFPDRQPGETVQLSVEKEGHEVINDLQLEAPLAPNTAGHPLTILLCPKGEREEWARRFYLRKNVEALDARYQERLAALAPDKSTPAKRSELQRAYNRAWNAAKLASEDLALPYRREAAPPFPSAMRLFLDGKIEDALRLLDQEKLNADLAAAVSEAQTVEDREEKFAIQHRILRLWLLKAQLHTIRLEFAEADAIYQAASAAVPDSFPVNFAVARFQQILGRHEKARVAYQRCLESSLMSEHPDCTAMTWIHLGELARRQHRFEEARTAYETAIRIFRELTRSHPEQAAALASTLDGFATVLQENGHAAEARTSLEECLEIQRGLARLRPELYSIFLVRTLKDLGDLHRDEKRRQEARAAYEEALSLFSDLARSHDAPILTAQAWAHTDFGHLCRSENQLDEAARHYAAALQIRRELAGHNAGIYLQNVSQSLSDLGLLRSQQGRKEEARTIFEELVGIRRELIKAGEEGATAGLAWALTRLGDLQREQHPAEADATYQEVLALYRQLARTDGNEYLPDITYALLCLGSIRYDQDKLTDAATFLREAEKTSRELARTDPKKHLPQMAQVLGCLGLLHGSQHQPKKARSYYSESLQIYQKLARQAPEVYATQVANVKELLQRLPP